MNRNQTINTLTITSPNYSLAALFALLTGFCIYQYMMMLAVIGFMLAVTAGTGAKTLSVDVSRRRYRVGSRLLGFNSGPWQALPPTQRVVVRYFSDLDVSVTDGGGVEHNQASRYTILLSVPNSQQADIVTSSGSYSHAVQIGCFLGIALGVEVVSFSKYKQQEVLQEAEPHAN